jgi:large subunit ribosomal protein L1
MDKKSIIKTIEELKDKSKKRNFSQSIDIIFTLKDINLKKPEEQVDFFVTLHYPIGKKRSVCALVGADLYDECEKVCDETISQSQFADFKDKKKAKQLAEKHDFFIAQGNLMGQVAATFGRVFGPRGKMPNPKVGAVVAAKPQIKPLYQRLQNTVKLTAKKQPVVHVMVGKEDQKIEEIVDNILYVYDQLIHHLPKEKNNINQIFLKFTMSKPVKI